MEGFSLSIESILAESVRMGASDTHITVGLPPMIRVDGMLMPLGNQPLTAADTEYLCKSMIDKSRQQYLNERGEIDFSYIVENLHLLPEPLQMRFLHVSSWDSRTSSRISL